VILVGLDSDFHPLSRYAVNILSNFFRGNSIFKVAAVFKADSVFVLLSASFESQFYSS
jgi:hypothetical protein